MQLMIVKLDLLYRAVFFAICHPGHLTQRALADNPFPVCYRETGIFVGFLAGFGVLSVIHRNRPRELPSGWVLATIAGAFALMAADGVSSYARLAVTTNATRLGTGLLVGFGISILIVPALNEALLKRASLEHLLSEPRKIGLFAAAIPAAFALIWIHPFGLGYLMPHLALAAVLLLLVCLNLLGIAAVPVFAKSEGGLVELAPWLGAASGLAGVELALLFLAHSGMHG